MSSRNHSNNEMTLFLFRLSGHQVRHSARIDVHDIECRGVQVIRDNIPVLVKRQPHTTDHDGRHDDPAVEGLLQLDRSVDDVKISYMTSAGDVSE